MDIIKVKKNRAARNSRKGLALEAFIQLYSTTREAISEVSKLGASESTRQTLLKAHVINTVTAVEVYYRDILDFIFRICKHSSYSSNLKRFHDRNYKINDLIELRKNNIDPLELVANSINFQNIQSIEKIFSILIGTSFFKQVKRQKWRVPMIKEEIYITEENINSLQEFFDVRHQLIHNPNSSVVLTEEIITENLGYTIGIIISSNMVLMKFIDENIDPSVVTNLTKKTGEILR